MAVDGENPYSWGAEATIYLGEFLGRRVVVKKRRSKPYRHPLYDSLFIQSRTRTEAKILVELYTAGINVPAPIIVDIENGVLVMEYVEGERMSEALGAMSIEAVVDAARDVGRQTALMHNMGVYHGDLTLANMIRSRRGVYIIDFGLAGYSTDIEEYAIDIHLLRKSVSTLHPPLLQPFMDAFMEAYKGYYKGNYEELLQRLREVSIRGRYVDRELRRMVMRERYLD